MLYVPNRWNDGDAIFRNSVAIFRINLAIFSNMTSTVDNLKQIRTLIILKNDLGDDSRGKNSQFNERNNLRYAMTKDMRKCFGVYVCVGDEVIAW